MPAAGLLPSVSPALLVALPLAVAALLAVGGRRLPRRVLDVTAATTAGAEAVLAALLLRGAVSGRDVATWVGGYRPRGGASPGIVLVADRMGAGLCLLTAVLVLAVLVYSWRYFEAVEVLYHALVLVFLAAVSGFVLSGDLFDMFVFFELLGVVAYALTGYRVDAEQPLQGALTFAVTNTVGGLFVLVGIGLLYGRAAQLGLAPLGVALAGHPPDALVVAAFVLVSAGWLVKAAAVPFHFWTADAEAVAPTPACVLFSCVMVELGAYAIARVYWTVFSGTITPAALRGPLVVLGAVTAVVGAVMCVVQHHLKRLLAFSTVSHSGIFVIGVGLMTPRGLAAAAVYALGHAGVKGALFLAVGIIVHRYDSVSERDLHGRVRAAPVAVGVLVVGGLALAGLPPFGVALGKSELDDAATAAGYGWLPFVILLASGLTGGAVLRVAARVGPGLGRPAAGDRSESASEQEDEQETEQPTGRRTPLAMLVPMVGLLGAALAAGLLPALRAGVGAASAALLDRGGYVAQVLAGSGQPPQHLGLGGFEARAVASALAGVVLALGVAVLAVSAHGQPAVLRRLRDATRPLLGGLRQLHSGHVGDYVSWEVAGVAVLGGVLTLTAL